MFVNFHCVAAGVVNDQVPFAVSVAPVVVNPVGVVQVASPMSGVLSQKSTTMDCMAADVVNVSLYFTAVPLPTPEVIEPPLAPESDSCIALLAS